MIKKKPNTFLYIIDNEPDLNTTLQSQEYARRTSLKRVTNKPYTVHAYTVEYTIFTTLHLRINECNERKSKKKNKNRNKNEKTHTTSFNCVEIMKITL